MVHVIILYMIFFNLLAPGSGPPVWHVRVAVGGGPRPVRVDAPRGAGGPDPPGGGTVPGLFSITVQVVHLRLMNDSIARELHKKCPSYSITNQWFKCYSKSRHVNLLNRSIPSWVRV